MIFESTSQFQITDRVGEIESLLEVLKINCLAGERNANVICRRPDGGVSDIVVKTDEPMSSDACPMCGSEMRFSQMQQSYLCSHDHPLVVMTTLATTNRHFQPKVATVTVVPKKKKSFFSRIFSRKKRNGKVKQSQKVDMKDVKRQVADALEDLL